MTTDSKLSIATFADIGLPAPILRALSDAGYKTPTPIQARTIPSLLENGDVIAQAQTGTGKTAAFALPLLSKIDTSHRRPQLLVLAPTRELANQVADGFRTYARHLPELNVLPVYGGSDYDTQLRGLRQGAQVVVGTPGRVMDHIRRGTLVLENLLALVLDEADEMLRMGFIDDVEWILEHISGPHQTALFSATMPKQIRRIAAKYLTSPEEIIIESRMIAADSISQRYVVLQGAQKADGLIRILEMETHDGVMVFVKTKTATVEVAEKLAAAGLSACALNGDMSQSLRERTVSRLKSGKLNILVATDVAARGLDVDRISHVIHFDVPNDAETYVHRTGRTGRAGRSGEAILFLTPKEKRYLLAIERATEQPITAMNVPSIDAINQKRIAAFHQKITETINTKDTSFYQSLIEKYFIENDADPLVVSAAVAHILQGKKPLLLKDSDRRARPLQSGTFEEKSKQNRNREDRLREPRRDALRGERQSSNRQHTIDAHSAKRESALHIPGTDMSRFKIEVGEFHGVTASNIVGAIANEANISSRYIGRIRIFDDYSIVELPKETPRKLWRSLKKTQVCNRPMNISKWETAEPAKPARSRGPKNSPQTAPRKSSHKSPHNSKENRRRRAA
ncbi:MAG: DEAD/DEAH box helicase [Deltaproteobacteria bacterium]|nr:DEAD/DEAH box helicase [Deltaproteobacteria bacterium]MBN2671974.1 DEAD/DEAH box helicase [Deltaproteobacteria bacterium]